jgi:hypothetical protein
MAAIDNTMIANILGATTPTGAAGIPGAFTVLAASAMRIRLNSTASTGTAAGTEIPTQTSGYTTAISGGWTTLGQSTTSGTPAVVGVPLTTQSLVSIGGVVAAPGIVSFDLQSSAGVRAWFGNFNGQPIAVASGNTFQVTGGSGAAAGIQISLT